jgi:hypothetical protein
MYELVFDSALNAIWIYLMASGTHPGHQNWVKLGTGDIPCKLEGTSINDLQVIYTGTSAPTPTGYPYQLPPAQLNFQTFGGVHLETPKAVTCTCGSYTKNHWADCALITSK